MALVTLLYNVAMAVADTAALVSLGRHPTMGAWFWTCLLVATAALALALVSAVVLAQSLFVAMRLLAFGVFLHGTIILAGAAWLVRHPHPKTAIGSALLAVAVAAVAAHAFWIEPTWLEVSRFRISSNKIKHPVRIVLLADLQTDVIGPFEQRVLRQALEECDPTRAEPATDGDLETSSPGPQKSRPKTLILLAGDYLHADRPRWEGLRRELNALLRELEFSAPAGVFAVRGNVDPADWAEIFAGLPVTTVESTESFQLGDLWLTCLGRRDSFDRLLRLRSPDPERFHLVLGHSPNYALGQIEADLLLAGHTHGGQVRLPLVGPVMTLSEVPRAWAAGLTELPGGARLLVSRGLGMERSGAPRLRFLCRPQLVVIELTPR